jgi:hypothetical protein
MPTSGNTVYFSPLQAKIKPHEGVINVRLFLDLLARLQTHVCIDRP